ncbi:MAG: type II toxin-antitoxin system CcdA family antitoxin [Zoogloeaceae bacterium]|jgi:post-segregation antitoxin (ccd killing protein)/predicted RNase H-like HicB family nuclease|nr:type II toxin-antitoxin system CcdA family antitoxin [Zoogloeaceae bacterium]
MKTVYPVILVETADAVPFLAYSPDFDRMTQGESLPDALEMAADLIETLAAEREDSGESLPDASPLSAIDGEAWAKRNAPDYQSVVTTLVIADLEAQRLKRRHLSVRRNVSLPAWLDEQAKKSGINVSAVLTDALKKELRFTTPHRARRTEDRRRKTEDSNSCGRESAR